MARASMPPSHRRAITDILACRTEALGGHLWRCDQCGAEVFAYHSCKNRSCPKCHTDQTERWLEARKLEMLPTPYFHVTITVPEELRAVLRANQRDGYALLMKAAAEAIIETRPRSALRRRHRRRARRASYLDPTAPLPPACPLPGQRRRRFPGRLPLASGPQELPRPGQGPGQAGARQAQGRVPEEPA